jgi:hypothetical protein
MKQNTTKNCLIQIPTINRQQKKEFQWRKKVLITQEISVCFCFTVFEVVSKKNKITQNKKKVVGK